MNKFQSVLLISAFALVGEVSLAGSLDGAIPLALLRDAQSRKCSPISEFFNRDGITLPPFYFDDQKDNKDYKAAYVCERNKVYLLVFMSIQPSGTCKRRELNLGQTMPGGLTAFSRVIPLSAFRSFDELKKPIEPNAENVTRYRPLTVAYDGVERVLYCYRGQWLEALFD